MKFGIHSEQYQNNYSKEEEQKFTQVFGELTSEFASKMAEGVQAGDESVQALVKQHSGQGSETMSQVAGRCIRIPRHPIACRIA